MAYLLIGYNNPLNKKYLWVPPEGYSTAQNGKICKLKGSYMDIIRPPWHYEFTNKLQRYGFDILVVMHTKKYFLTLLV